MESVGLFGIYYSWREQQRSNGISCITVVKSWFFCTFAHVQVLGVLLPHVKIIQIIEERWKEIQKPWQNAEKLKKKEKTKQLFQF